MRSKTLVIAVLVLILVIYLSLFISPIFYSKKMEKTEQQIILTAHRCGAGLAPENTLLGVKESLVFMPDRIEIDVHMTKDSTIVVIHDESIDRTTNGKGKIKDLTYPQILEYFAIDNTSKQITSEKIPTLDQIIEAIDGRSNLLIEIKQGNEIYPGIEKKVIESIQKHNAKSWCIIQSFNLDILKTVHQLDKTIKLHKLYFGKIPYLPIWISNKMEFGSLKNLDFVSEISFMYLFATKHTIANIHKHNKKANVWTVDNEERIKQLVNIGIDGVITNHPELEVFK